MSTGEERERRSQRLDCQLRTVGAEQGLHELLVRRGAEFLAEPHIRDGETRAYFRDPDGHLFEISQLT